MILFASHGGCGQRMASARQFTVDMGALARGAGLALMLALPGSGAVSSAFAQGASCAQLEASLASLDRQGGRNGRAQAGRIRADLNQLSAQARNMGCDAPRGFLIFQGPPRPPQCDQISDQISRLRSQLAGAEQAGNSNQGQRRALIIALAQNNCGPQYSAAVRPAPSAQPRQPRNFLEALFGVPAQSEPEASPDLEVLPIEPPKASTYKTVCVRTCDGYYFPLTNYSGPSSFPSQDALCKRLCPATDAQLFAFSSGGSIKQATNVAGQAYMDLPNALRYRKEFVSGCSCRAPGQSWAQALAGVEDQTTLRKGDILVTEEQAREMSQPKPNDGGAKGKSDAAKTAVAPPGSAQVEAPSLAATVAAPLAPASEQPGQRRVRIIPLPKSRTAATAVQEAAVSDEIGAGSVPIEGQNTPSTQ